MKGQSRHTGTAHGVMVTVHGQGHGHESMRAGTWGKKGTCAGTCLLGGGRLGGLIIRLLIPMPEFYVF